MDNRHRKTPYHRHDWRSKAQVNQSTHRYKRDFILKHYQNLPPPAIVCRDQILEVVFDEPNPPLLNAFFPFTQPFGEEPNSRKYPQREKRPEQMPEWYQDDESLDDLKPSGLENSNKTGLFEGLVRNSDKGRVEMKIGSIGEEEIEDRFSKIDLQVEQKLRMENEDESEKVPEWDEPDEADFEFAEKGGEGEGNRGGRVGYDARPAHNISANPLIPQTSKVPHSAQVSRSPPVPQPPQAPQAPQVPRTAQHAQHAHPSPAVPSSHTAIPRAPVYDINLIKYHLAIANPFAQILITFLTPLEGPAVTFTPGTKPFEKMWFYKDLEEKVHGPFSTLEMFSWTIRNCFPPDLQIALAPLMTFVPMYIFNSLPQEAEFYPEPGESFRQAAKKDYKKYQKPNESATLYLKDMLGINKRGK